MSIRVKEYVVFDGHKGWEHEGKTYRLACGPIIGEAPDGTLVAFWLSGTDKEPSTDNCVLISRSSDRGHTWGEPSIFIPAGEQAGAATVVFVHEGKLVVFGAHWPADQDYTEWHYTRMESADNGLTWEDVEHFDVNGSHASMDNSIVLSSGDRLFPGQFFDRRPQPLVGPIEKLALAKTEEEALAIPPDEGRKGGKFSTHLHGCCVFISEGLSGHDLKMFGHIDDRPLGLLESTCVELRDGRIVMIMRAEWGGFLWRAESEDGGRTWSKAWQTDIPNPTTKPNLVRMADGRIALIHNATGGVPGKRGRRDPLSIWISDDELKTFPIREDVITGGQLAYPCGIVVDDKLVFIYDHDRRQIRYVEVDVD